MTAELKPTHCTWPRGPVDARPVAWYWIIAAAQLLPILRQQPIQGLLFTGEIVDLEPGRVGVQVIDFGANERIPPETVCELVFANERYANGTVRTTVQKRTVVGRLAPT